MRWAGKRDTGDVRAIRGLKRRTQQKARWRATSKGKQSETGEWMVLDLCVKNQKSNVQPFIRKELIVFLPTWFWTQAKHVFFRTPTQIQRKQYQSSAVMDRTSEVELRDWCPHPICYPFKKVMNIHKKASIGKWFHYCCHVLDESHYSWRQALPLLTSVHLLWWALLSVYEAKDTWYTQTHTSSHRWGQSNNKPLLFFLFFTLEWTNQSCFQHRSHVLHLLWVMCERPPGPIGVFGLLSDPG